MRDIPGGVWALGFVSMLMDISSEMIHALLPVYLVTVLGTSALAVGVIEERVAVAFDTAARCGAVVLTDQCSMRSFASLRPTPEWSR